MSLTSKFAPKSVMAVFMIAGLGLTLTGCSTGSDAPTRMIKKVTDGAEADSGAIKARDVLLVAQPDGAAALVGTVVNTGDSADQLLSISVDGLPATLSASPIDLVLDKPAIFAGDSANQSAVIPGLNKAPSSRATVVFTFQSAGAITLDAIVREKSDVYANVGN
ncbi:MAG: hypothetical protein WCO85_03370 [Actinomycetes bacterium]